MFIDGRWWWWSVQYQEEIDALNQVARHRPRSSLVLGIQQENRQIRDLQQENRGKSRTERRENRQIRSFEWMEIPAQSVHRALCY